ncbi:MAG: hypothetical protein HMLKMBBP_00263 [Planctomycetes bacterium]|nr:hypothetical protein [Planctomycetota bacterium]
MGIRDIVLLGIVLVTLPLSVFQPFFGLLVFTWFACMRPNDMTWGINQLRPSLMIAIATVIGVLLSKREKLFVLETRTVLLGTFLAAIGVSCAVAHDPAFSFTEGRIEDLAKIIFIAVLTTGLCNTKDRVRLMLLVIGGSFGLLALKGSLQGVLSPGHPIHGPGGPILDNNDFGLALVMALPLLAYTAREERGPFLRAILTIMAVACVTGVLFTRSRGGILALTAMGIVWLWKLRRNAWALIAAPTFLAAIIVLAPNELWVRVRNLTEGAHDPSAQGRLVAWEKAANMAAANPVFGVGPGNFATPDYWYAYEPTTSGVAPVVAHNTYFQIVAESGFVGLAVFVLMLAATLWGLSRTARPGGEPWRVRYSEGSFLSLVGFMAGCMFLTRTHFDLVYQLVGLSVAIRAAGSDAGAFDWTFGLRRRIFGEPAPAAAAGGAPDGSEAARA